MKKYTLVIYGLQVHSPGRIGLLVDALADRFQLSNEIIGARLKNLPVTFKNWVDEVDVQDTREELEKLGVLFDFTDEATGQTIGSSEARVEVPTEQDRLEPDTRLSNPIISNETSAVDEIPVAATTSPAESVEEQSSELEFRLTPASESSAELDFDTSLAMAESALSASEILTNEIPTHDGGLDFTLADDPSLVPPTTSPTSLADGKTSTLPPSQDAASSSQPVKANQALEFSLQTEPEPQTTVLQSELEQPAASDPLPPVEATSPPVTKVSSETPEILVSTATPTHPKLIDDFIPTVPFYKRNQRVILMTLGGLIAIGAAIPFFSQRDDGSSMFTNSIDSLLSQQEEIFSPTPVAPPAPALPVRAAPQDLRSWSGHTEEKSITTDTTIQISEKEGLYSISLVITTPPPAKLTPEEIVHKIPDRPWLSRLEAEAFTINVIEPKTGSSPAAGPVRFRFTTSAKGYIRAGEKKGERIAIPVTGEGTLQVAAAEVRGTWSAKLNIAPGLPQPKTPIERLGASSYRVLISGTFLAQPTPAIKDSANVNSISSSSISSDETIHSVEEPTHPTP